MDDLRHQDEERISRWMRLMLGDVEVSDAKGEVDGIQILEGFRKIRTVERQKGEGEKNRADRQRRSHADRGRSPSIREELNGLGNLAMMSCSFANGQDTVRESSMVRQ
jgi:hypothetical protein